MAWWRGCGRGRPTACPTAWASSRSEEHTSELQSRRDVVCRLPLEKKKLLRYMRPLVAASYPLLPCPRMMKVKLRHFCAEDADSDLMRGAALASSLSTGRRLRNVVR